MNCRVIQVLAYGSSADAIDDCVCIGEDTILEAVRRFTKVVIVVFRLEYLREPTEEDIQRLMTEGEVRVWPRMLGVLSYMQWTWKNCPAGWKG